MVLGAVGAVIGGIYGGSSGAQAGWLIGSAIGGAIDPDIIGQTGPRINDLRVQFSSYGALMPQYYGAMRGAGNIIWATPIKETKFVNDDDGKGGPRIETTTYTYSIDIAISLCAGEIVGVRKVWANGILIYNVDSNASLGTLIQSRQNVPDMAVYTGSETQMPDPTMEAELGAGNVPAYRGQAYVVFTNFQLDKFNNRVPNFEFEVVSDGSIGYSLKETLSVPSFSAPYKPASLVPFVDSDAVWRYQGQWHQNSSARPLYMKVFQLFPDGATALYKTFAIGGTSFAGIARMSTDTNGFVAVTSGSTQLIHHDKDGKQKNFTVPISLGYDNTVVAKSGNYFVAASSSSGTAKPIYIFSYSIGSALFSASPYLTINAVTGKRFQSLAILNDTLYALAIISSAYVIERYDLTTGSLVSSFSVALSVTNREEQFIVAGDDDFYMIASQNIYHVTSSGNSVVTSFSLIPTASRHIDFQYKNQVFYVSSADNGTPAIDVTKAYSDSLGNNEIELSAIVADQCERAGLDSSEVDVTELDAALVHGYAVTRQGSARANIVPLQKAYYFDAVEADGKLVFKNRGGDVAVSIPENDLGAHDADQEPSEALTITRTQEMELPFRTTVKYINLDADYQQGAEAASRQLTSSEQDISEEIPIAITPDKAAQIAEVLLFDAHTGRTSYTFETTRKYAKYLPTDVVTVTVGNTSYRIRLTKKDESISTIKWEGVADDATIYSSTSVGGTQQSAQQQVTTPGITRVEFLDIPILRDEDDDSGFYVAMGGFKPEWSGAKLFRSSDDLTYSEVGSAVNNATLGICDTTLGNHAGGNFFDEKNTIQVTITSGQLVSHTYDEVLNGANVALVGSEIIQFRTATLLSENTYLLSGLLRGRRGTEQRISTHDANELFALLSVAGIVRPAEGNSAIGSERYYKGVSFGRRLNQTDAFSFTNNAVGLMPFSPVGFSGGKQANGDFIINWIRRTRIDGEWRNNVDAILGETTESYEIDVMNGSSVIRTLTSTTQTVTYTSAMQVTDFGSGRSSITVNVYQISDKVGRGFAGTKTY